MSPDVVEGCTFCAIVAGQVPAAVVRDEAEVLAFLDVRPLFPGHVLVVPKAHVVTLAELAPPAVGPYFDVVRRTAVAVQRGMEAQGTFVANNNVVSQSVPHLHVHVVPRTKGDGLRGFFWPRQRYADEDAMADAAVRVASSYP